MEVQTKEIVLHDENILLLKESTFDKESFCITASVSTLFFLKN